MGPFTFRRAWYYWVVEGPMPLAIAEELYANHVGKRDVRVGGHCGCPSPSTYGVQHYDGDGKMLRPIESDDYRLVSKKSWPGGVMAEVLAVVKRECSFVSDPRASAVRSIVDLYHIDSAQGLRLFADTVRRHGLEVEK